ncbi:MAG: hypothetical protein A4E58_02250 [Syntrophorhabdus sp. PtaB.Bin006]|nr:MAG: hypothetical protein A4E58_02250 [Syntrophorhabdus sp. PtaB.Bin006]
MKWGRFGSPPRRVSSVDLPRLISFELESDGDGEELAIPEASTFNPTTFRGFIATTSGNLRSYSITDNILVATAGDIFRHDSGKLEQCRRYGLGV